TEIEKNILEGFLKVIIESLQEAWKPILDVDFQIAGCETCPQLLQIVAPNEIVITVIFHVRIGEARGTMSLCIPAINLEPIIHKFNQSFYTRVSNVPPEQTRALLDNLSQVALPVTFELHGTTATVAELLQISSGDLIRTDRRINEPIEISISETVKLRGELIQQDKRLAVCVGTLVRNRTK
ncbi:MAG: FliM/FliN family flagellar motor switch protein, partial [Acidobacteriota bacterium]